MIDRTHSLYSIRGLNYFMRHAKVVHSFKKLMDHRCGFSDIVDYSTKVGTEEILFLIGTLLIDKFGYKFKSFNVGDEVRNPPDVLSYIKKVYGL